MKIMKYLLMFYLIFIVTSCSKDNLGKKPSQLKEKGLTVEIADKGGEIVLNGFLVPIKIRNDHSLSTKIEIDILSINYRFKNGIVIKKLHKPELRKYLKKTTIKMNSYIETKIPVPHMKGAPIKITIFYETYRSVYKKVMIPNRTRNPKGKKFRQIYTFVKIDKKRKTFSKEVSTSIFSRFKTKKMKITSKRKSTSYLNLEKRFLELVKQKKEGAWRSLSAEERRKQYYILKKNTLPKNQTTVK